MNVDEQQERRDQRKDKQRHRMVLHKVKSPRTGGRLVKVAVRRAAKRLRSSASSSGPQPRSSLISR